MNIPFEIGEKVYIKATITNISVNEKKEITYFVECGEFGARITEKSIVKKETEL